MTLDRNYPMGRHTRLLASDHLDMIRGLAAIAVLVYHVRYRFFFDYGDLAETTVVGKIFYSVTAFGHDAVMVFFVLSGYFISASIIRDNAQGRWSWKHYAINRTTRLYVVLLPALILTAGWDILGIHFFGENAIYTGAERPWSHDFFHVESRLGVQTAFENAAFLQMITSPPYGSNTPLWSLSFEWWYYVMFPLAWIALRKPRSLAVSGLQLLLFATILAAISREMVLYFPIWLMGYCIAVIPKVRVLKQWQSPVLTFGSALGFCGSVTLTHLGDVRSQFGDSVIALDYVTAASFAAFLYYLLHNEQTGAAGSYHRLASRLSAVSYTLYLTHMPLLVFLRAAFLPEAPWTPDLKYLLLAALIAGVVFGYSCAIAYFTEARTSRCRKYLLGLLATDRREFDCVVPVQREQVELPK